eukprot:2899488-Amphidinium_carterae.1
MVDATHRFTFRVGLNRQWELVDFVLGQSLELPEPFASAEQKPLLHVRADLTHSITHGSESAIVEDFSHAMLVEDAGTYFYFSESGDGEYDKEITEHSTKSLIIHRGAIHHCLKMFMFKHQQFPEGGNTLVSLLSVVEALGLDSKTARSTVVAKNMQSWQKFRERLGWHVAHLRQSMPLTRHKHTVTRDTSLRPPRDWRILPEPSVSVLFLIALSCRLGSKLFAQDDTHRLESWKALLVGICAVSLKGDGTLFLSPSIELSSALSGWRAVKFHDGELCSADLHTLYYGLTMPAKMSAALRDRDWCLAADVLEAGNEHEPKHWWRCLVASLARTFEQKLVTVTGDVIELDALQEAMPGTNRNARQSAITQALVEHQADSEKLRLAKYYWALREAFHGVDVLH